MTWIASEAFPGRFPAHSGRLAGGGPADISGRPPVVGGQPKRPAQVAVLSSAWEALAERSPREALR